MSAEIVQKVAILFEASPGFQQWARSRLNGSRITESQSSLKRVLVSNL